LPANKPNIGYGAPSLIDVATGRKCKLSSTKVTTRKKKKSPYQSPTVAPAPQTDVLANLPSSPSERNLLNSLVISFHLDTDHISNSLLRCPRGSIYRRRRRLPKHTSLDIINYSGTKLLSKCLYPFIILKLTFLFSLILSGTTFTFDPQKIQGNLSINPGKTSEHICKLILQTSNNYYSACPPITNRVVKPTSHIRYYDSGILIIASCPLWLQF